MAERPIRIALIGCGRISGNHIEAISATVGLELAAVCDTVSERASIAGQLAGVPWFSDYDEMLAQIDCDLVTIATPSGLHPEHGVRAARAGKHVVVEKPMAISLEGADTLLAACRTANVQLFVVKQNRLNFAVGCCAAPSTGAASGVSILCAAACCGRDRRSTTTRHRGAGRGRSTAARS